MYLRLIITLPIAMALVIAGLGLNTPAQDQGPEGLLTGDIPEIDKERPDEYRTVTFGVECFHTAETKLGVVQGVLRTRAGRTVVEDMGHYHRSVRKELVQVDYDPDVVSYDELVDALGDNSNPSLFDPLARFSLAEPGHQKRYLREHEILYEAYRTIYPDFDDWMNSTAVARANGYVVGHGDLSSWRDLDDLGLGEKGMKILYKAWADSNNVSCSIQTV